MCLLSWCIYQIQIKPSVLLVHPQNCLQTSLPPNHSNSPAVSHVLPTCHLCIHYLSSLVTNNPVFLSAMFGCCIPDLYKFPAVKFSTTLAGEKAGQWQAPLQIFQQMWHGAKPTGLMKSLTQKNLWVLWWGSDSEIALGEVQHQGTQEVLECAEAFFHCAGTHYSDAHDILEQLHGFRSEWLLQADEICLGAMVSACDKGGQWDLALLALGHSSSQRATAWEDRFCTDAGCFKAHQISLKYPDCSNWLLVSQIYISSIFQLLTVKTLINCGIS